MQRMTKQRQAVLDELTRVTDFRSAQQIFEDLHSQGHRVGLATVYRSLQGLAEDGRVDTLRSSDGESLYRSCTSNHHHHHLVCRECGFTDSRASNIPWNSSAPVPRARPRPPRTRGTRAAAGDSLHPDR